MKKVLIVLALSVGLFACTKQQKCYHCEVKGYAPGVQTQTSSFDVCGKTQSEITEIERQGTMKIGNTNTVTQCR